MKHTYDELDDLELTYDALMTHKIEIKMKPRMNVSQDYGL